MTTNITLFNFISVNDLVLEIPTEIQNQAANKAKYFSHPSTRYQGYLNELCLGTVLQWLQEEFTPSAKVWPNMTPMPNLWELLNGSAIVLDQKRIILVPTEAIDLSELRVPQEWVDIPTWSGDYYLAVQVEPDDCYVRIWGYCTHEQLKTKGNYEPSDRTYSLDSSDIISDMSVFFIARQLCPQEPTRIALPPLPTLTPVQAQNLISRLSNPEILTPRLAIPFEMWGGLIENDDCRRALYQKRLGLPEQLSPTQWLQSGVSQIAQQFGWGSVNLQLGVAGARSVTQTQPSTILSRQLQIAGQAYELRLIPRNEERTTIWRFELRHSLPGMLIEKGFILRLLTEDLQPFPNNEDVAVTAVELLFLEVILEPGEEIFWEVETQSEKHEREILKF